MKRSLIYYLSQIKVAYPEMKDIKKQEFEKITAEINAQIQAGEPVTAHKQLYSKTYRFLKKLANFYAENGIDYKSFNDNLSALQLEIMETLNNKVEKKEWYQNFEASYVPSISSSARIFIKNFQKECAFQEKLRAKLVENLLNDELMKLVYEKELKNVEINELKAILNDVLDTLTPREKEFVLKYYGLNGDKWHTMAEIGSSKDLSGGRVGQVLAKALRKLRHPYRAKKLYDFYKYDSD